VNRHHTSQRESEREQERDGGRGREREREREREGERERHQSLTMVSLSPVTPFMPVLLWMKASQVAADRVLTEAKVDWFQLTLHQIRLVLTATVGNIRCANMGTKNSKCAG
jgi:hypothetical protein